MNKEPETIYIVLKLRKNTNETIEQKREKLRFINDDEKWLVNKYKDNRFLQHIPKSRIRIVDKKTENFS